jgi:hypothetical protein
MISFEPYQFILANEDAYHDKARDARRTFKPSPSPSTSSSPSLTMKLACHSDPVKAAAFAAGTALRITPAMCSAVVATDTTGARRTRLRSRRWRKL